MKGVYVREYGGPEVLRYGEVPEPTLADGLVIVDIVAASVNRADLLVRSGAMGTNAQLPHVLGRDFAGIARNSAGDIRAGDPVFGVCDLGQEGAYAERIAIRPEIIAKIPDEVSFTFAVAAGLAGLTAMVTLEDTLAVQPDETVLINGSAGGVGSYAIALAKYRGARVIATASAANLHYVRELGADEALDYRSDAAGRIGAYCDAVFDLVGGSSAARVFDVLRPNGRAAFIASGPSAPHPERSDVTALRPYVGRDRSHLERLSKLLAAQSISTPEISKFALSDARSAHERFERGSVRGKIVLEVQ